MQNKPAIPLPITNTFFILSPAYPIILECVVVMITLTAMNKSAQITRTMMSIIRFFLISESRPSVIIELLNDRDIWQDSAAK